MPPFLPRNPLGGNPARKRASRKQMVSTDEPGNGIVVTGVEANTTSRPNVRCDRRIRPPLRPLLLPLFPVLHFPPLRRKRRRRDGNLRNIPLPPH